MPETAPNDTRPRTLQTAITDTQGILMIGRLRELADRSFVGKRDGKLIENVDATIMVGDGLYRVSMGNQLRAKALTGHVAPWHCDPETAGDPIGIPVRLNIAEGPTGTFISYRADAPTA